ncbi:TNF receptor-associated factor 6-like isoform X2 [Acropora muricata]|uniref:TNF receptor-associated factor 6-like isoform X2 n=1 Tax=Acropora muricata TaxID=159855 RepID=UPI0034E527B8
MSRSFGSESFMETSTNPEGYDEYFDPPLENQYECPICLLGLREPVQTPCGHRFCRGCILRSWRDAGPKCPVDNQFLDDLQLNPDMCAKREMLNRPVFCRLKKVYECPWKGPLGKLEMQDHNEKECPRAELKCPFSVVGCPFEGTRPAVNEHVKKMMLSHLMDLTKEFGALKIERSGLQAPKSLARRTRGGVKVQEQASQDVLLMNLATLCQRQQTEINELRRLVNEGKGVVEHLEHRLNESYMTPLQELTIRLNRQETKAFEFEGRVCNGSYTWKIENYRQRRQDAISGIATALHSPAFYTSLYGYKLCLRINLNGVDSGVGRYIALFVHMMQGDYDSILEWPFTGRITLTILDQSEGTEFRQHISETLIAKPSLLAFQRPTAPRNYKGYGYVEFAPIEHIRDPQYIKNNTMLVRIQIDH